MLACVFMCVSEKRPSSIFNEVVDGRAGGRTGPACSSQDILYSFMPLEAWMESGSLGFLQLRSKRERKKLRYGSGTGRQSVFFLRRQLRIVIVVGLVSTLGFEFVSPSESNNALYV